MKQLTLAMCVLWAACGGEGGTPVTPDAPPGGVDAMTDAPLPVSWQVGCTETTATGEPFDEAADFGPAAPGSLAGWDANGRWFFTGTRVGGVSSVHVAREGNTVVVDRDPRTPGTIDDTVLFHRASIQFGNGAVVIAKRISDLQPDGRLRADRAVCEGAQCRVCTATLVRAAHVDPQPSDGLTLLAELKGPDWDDGITFNVRVVGTLAYLIRQDGLRIIETADPANPVELAHWRRNGDGYSNDLKVVQAGARRYVLIADYPVDIIDVTNPRAPQLVGQIAEEAHTLFTETRDGKTLAYFGNYDSSTPVYDVTNPTQPVRLGRYDAGASFAGVHDLSVANGIAYLNAWNLGMQVVDFTNPASPQLRGTFPSPTDTSHSNWTTTAGGRPIVLVGDEDYGGHLDVVDNDPASPTYLTSLAKYRTRDHVSIHNIMAIGTKAYFAYYQDGVRVLDVSDPTQPQLAGYYNTWDPQADYTSSSFFEGALGLDVDVARKLVFVADSPRGLLILRDDT